MVGVPSDKPIEETSPEEVREEEDKVDQDDPRESDEEKENPQEESIEKTPELCDDVVAQEPQAKESDDESRSIVSDFSASCSAINEEKVDQDDPQESDEEKENPREESIEKTPELCDDVVAQEPQVKESDEFRPIVSGSSASCSAISETELKKTDEASKKMDPSSSRKGKEICEIKTGDKEDDHNDDDDSKDCEFPYPEYETSSVITQPEEILSTLSLYQNPNRSSETEMCQVMVLPQENVGLGSLDPQSSYQISRIARMVNQQQQFIIPNQPFGMQLPLPTMMLTSQPRPSVVDHNYGAGFDPMAAPWRPPTITSQGPRNIYPTFPAPMPSMMFAIPRSIVAVRRYSDQPSGMQHQMDTDPIIVRAQALREHLMRLEDNPQYQRPTNLPMIPVTNEQNQIVAYLAPGIAPMMQAPMMAMMNQHVQMRPEANQQDQVAPNLLMRHGTNLQNQIVPYLAPGQAPMMHQHVQMRPEANQQDEVAPNLLMRPGTNQQNQIFPYLAPGQAPMMHQHVQMRPEANQQDEVAPNLPMIPGTNQQNQIVPYLASGQAPMMFQHVQMRPEGPPVYEIVPNLLMRPLVNQQNQLVSFQGPAMPVMYRLVQMRPEADQQNQTYIFVYPGQITYNPQQQVMSPQMSTIAPSGMPRSSVVNMIDQASPNAAAATRPQHNQQQMLQLQSQAQQRTQSQGFDAGSSSDQSQD